jgi:N-glycosylase/DNA lyase
MTLNVKKEINKIDAILSIVAGNTLTDVNLLMEGEAFKEMFYSMLTANKTIKEIAEALTEYATNELI